MAPARGGLGVGVKGWRSRPDASGRVSDPAKAADAAARPKRSVSTTSSPGSVSLRCLREVGANGARCLRPRTVRPMSLRRPRRYYEDLEQSGLRSRRSLHMPGALLDRLGDATFVNRATYCGGDCVADSSSRSAARTAAGPWPGASRLRSATASRSCCRTGLARPLPPRLDTGPAVSALMSSI